MKRSVKSLKKLWRDKQDAIDKLMLKVGTCHESETHIINGEINVLVREKTAIETEMYGDWAPKERE